MKLKMLTLALTIMSATSLHAATMINCSKACSTCSLTQICMCDPGNGFLCIDKKENVDNFDLESLLGAIDQ